jgi:hypothetical protein
MIAKAIIMGTFVFITTLVYYNLSVFAGEVVAPRVWETVFLDMQYFGYSCDQVVSVFKTLNTTQRELIISEFYFKHDIYYPVSLMVNYGYIIYLLAGRFTWLVLLPALHCLSDLFENTFHVLMLRAYEAQSSANLPIDLSPYCHVAGQFATRFKVATYLAFDVAIIYLLVKWARGGTKEKKQ